MWDKSLPLYKQIANRIKEDIISAKLAQGDAIPTETKLAHSYGVSRVTVRQAIKLLVEEKLLYRVQGSGTYISHNKVEHNIYKLQSFTEEMIRLDHQPSNEIIEFQLTLPSVEVQDVLNVSEDDKVYYIKRLRLADKEAFILEESYLPVELFPDLSIDVMKESKYDYIEQKGHQIDKRYGELYPIMPTKEIVDFLQVEENEPLLYLKAFSTFVQGTVFEYSKIYFHPSKYVFKFISLKDRE
ncbi:hypothetical protein M948_04280 [Virgibacillus sp. CM-4]|uniref:GntR family transcriptional regulator n=1 Tax=Virgibacillus sp. CM-4 TaxID=1354277 RepID=UPI0003885DE6|nr:GntR family transcriptional regulator [Virgibacillus sp. CM-4]EQB37785.1 hypothetical protein M948_04280 [Virgibacillus sp. CM-4]